LEQLIANFPAKQGRFHAGMPKAALYSLLTVADLAAIIRAKLEAGGSHA
jgi:hypothetical protein